MKAPILAITIANEIGVLFIKLKYLLSYVYLGNSRCYNLKEGGGDRMVEKKTHQEKTSAGDKLIGFEYQYYYFLLQILCLESDETIGLEIKDDVHIDYSNGEQVLMQLKHSVQQNASGDIINLRESDTDLWKTIYNWVKTINDIEEGRIDEAAQLNFINRTSFVLVSNKSHNIKNQFILHLENYKKGDCDFQEFKVYLDNKLSELAPAKKSDEVSQVYLYVQELLKQSEKWLEAFFGKLSLLLNEDDLIERIKIKIKEKFIPEERIEAVFSSLDSNIRRDNYISIKSHERLEYSFKELHSRYTKCFNEGRNKKPTIVKTTPTLPEDLENQIFIKQLEDIGIIDKRDSDYIDEVVSLTITKLLTRNNLERWNQEGIIMGTDIEKFEHDSIYIWRRVYKSTYASVKKQLRDEPNSVSDAELNKLANHCLNEVLSKELTIDEYELDLELSNGQYYLLSDRPKIGWKIDWQRVYSDE